MKINEVEAELATLCEANTKFGMALVQQVQKTKQQADDIYVLTEQGNSAIVTPPVAQPALSVAATYPAQPTSQNTIQVHTTKRYDLFTMTNQVCLPPVYTGVLKYSSRHITQQL